VIARAAESLFGKTNRPSEAIKNAGSAAK